MISTSLWVGLRPTNEVYTMIQLLILAIVKIIDNIILTGKTILVQKNKALFASIAIVISQLLFYFVIDHVISANNTVTIVVVSMAAGIGSYIAFLINKRVSRDRLWVHIVTSNDRTSMKELGDYMRTNNISIITFDSYSDNLERTLTALIFANTRNQSSQIDRYLNGNTNYKRQIVSE